MPLEAVAFRVTRPWERQARTRAESQAPTTEGRDRHRSRPSLVKCLSCKDSPFAARHRPRTPDLETMLGVIGVESLDELAAKALPARPPRHTRDSGRPWAAGTFADRRASGAGRIASWPTPTSFAVFDDRGYYDTLTPPVLLLAYPGEPAWYRHPVPADQPEGPVGGAAELPGP